MAEYWAPKIRKKKSQDEESQPEEQQAEHDTQMEGEEEEEEVEDEVVEVDGGVEGEGKENKEESESSKEALEENGAVSSLPNLDLLRKIGLDPCSPEPPTLSPCNHQKKKKWPSLPMWHHFSRRLLLQMIQLHALLTLSQLIAVDVLL